ncbi:hypothetical protein [Streptomyces sp. B6B3]|uniref:hypothetical protein n=1 Tax=Streptomyces sp. B6B3 TaxID=3153570 RepID=UPI00325E6164
MSTNTPDSSGASGARGPLALARRVTMPLFKTGLVVFLLLGLVVVVSQAIGVAGGDPGLVSGAVDTIGRAMTVVAGLTGLLAFAMSYLFSWDSGGED